MWLVELEQVFRHATDRRQGNDSPILQTKVLSPTVSSRVEQTLDSSRLDIDGRQVTSLQEIAQITSPSEVVFVSWPAVLLGDDVIRLVREVRIVLVDQAVLASTLCACLDETPEGR